MAPSYCSQEGQATWGVGFFRSSSVNACFCGVWLVVRDAEAGDAFPIGPVGIRDAVEKAINSTGD
jgi:hypothetical protein